MHIFASHFLPFNGNVIRPLGMQIEGRMVVFNFVLEKSDAQANRIERVIVI